MDDSEFGNLESQLRAAAVGHRPPAPDGLLDFIGGVPAGHRRARRLELVIGRGARRAAFGLVAAAAVVAAVATTSVLMAVRNGQSGASPKPTASVDPAAPALAGWTWQRADGTVVLDAARVANGYLAQCGPASWELCTSPDGRTWTRPPAPSVMGTWDPQPAMIRPEFLARYGGAWLANGGTRAADASPCGSAEPCEFMESVWRSTDGVRWTALPKSAFPAMSVTNVYALPGGFFAQGSGPNGLLGWTSTDGLHWKTAPSSPFLLGHAGTVSVGPAGLYYADTDAGGVPRRTTDGKTWTPVQLPSGLSKTVPMVDAVLPGGGFVGIVDRGSNTTLALSIVRSEDGVHWVEDAGDLAGAVESRVVGAAGGDLFVSVKGDGVWRSADAGRTWQPLLDGAGRAVTGAVACLTDLPRSACERVAIRDAGQRLIWVGSPTKP